MPGAQVPRGRGLQSAFINKRTALDNLLPIITQGFNPGGPAPQKTTKHHKKRQKTFTLKSTQAFLSLRNLWRKALDHLFLIITQGFNPGGGGKRPSQTQ